MITLYTETQFEELEQEERTLTEEAIVVMLVLLGISKANLEKELRNFYQKYGEDGIVTWNEARKWVSDQDHSRRLTALLLLISDEFDSLLGHLNNEFKSFLVEVIQKENDFFNSKISDDKVLTKKWGTDESNWETRLSDDVALWSLVLGNDLKRLILREANIDEVLEQFEKRFSTMEKVTKKLAMTESTAIGSMSRKEIFKKLGITKYRWYTKEDERVCETCGVMHGLEFPISAYELGVTVPPLHPYCRCQIIPINE